MLSCVYTLKSEELESNILAYRTHSVNLARVIHLFPPKHPRIFGCIEPNPLVKSDDSVTKLGLGQNILWYNIFFYIGQRQMCLKK